MGSAFWPSRFAAQLSASFPSSSSSWVIVGATVIDGSGQRRFRATVRIVGDRIVRIGRFAPEPGERVLQASGLILAPGFIDLHNHSDRGLDAEPTATSQIAQGITTVALGLDGSSPWPIADYLRRRRENPAAVNVLLFVGHATVRRMVMGNETNRPASDREIAEMERLVEQGMREGAFGLSTGLEYDIGYPSTTEEIIALARVVGRQGGLYVSHIRDEGDRMLEALEEALRIGREARIPVHISHIKLATVSVWGKAREVVARIERARREGLDITADAYPYEAWASTITVLVPSRRHDDPAAVAKGLEDVGGADRVLIVTCPAHPEYEGKTLQEIARERGLTPVQIYMEIVRDGGAMVVCRSMQEADLRVFYRQPWVMVASDGGIGMRHPRGAGAFPRVLARYVRQERLLTLEEAIRKMTGLPAARLGLNDRGLIREGFAADLVLFDPRRVQDRASFREPHLLPEGIEYVFTNGRLVWERGRPTGERPGLALVPGKRPERPVGLRSEKPRPSITVSEGKPLSASSPVEDLRPQILQPKDGVIWPSFGFSSNAGLNHFPNDHGMIASLDDIRDATLDKSGCDSQDGAPRRSRLIVVSAYLPLIALQRFEEGVGDLSLILSEEIQGEGSGGAKHSINSRIHFDGDDDKRRLERRLRHPIDCRCGCAFR
jgi:N-acyl-D-amino-acid deacylase